MTSVPTATEPTPRPRAAHPLIIDCDPGVDDTLALMLALRARQHIQLEAITTVGGNVAADLTARNALIACALAGRSDVPVYRGADRPLRREAVAASHFHGPEGLGDLPVPLLDASVAEGDSADAIIAHSLRHPKGAISLCALGPLTNVALALQKAPELATHWREVAIMGGARSEGGNITPSAEYNIYADPDAAEIVMASGTKVRSFGLDVTHQALALEERIARIEALGTAMSDTAARLLRFSRRVEKEEAGSDDAPLHDPCPVAWFVRPDLFRFRPAHIRVETHSELTRGHTSVDLRVGDDAPHLWAVGVDAEGLFDLLGSALSGEGSA